MLTNLAWRRSRVGIALTQGVPFGLAMGAWALVQGGDLASAVIKALVGGALFGAVMVLTTFKRIVRTKVRPGDDGPIVAWAVRRGRAVDPRLTLDVLAASEATLQACRRDRRRWPALLGLAALTLVGAVVIGGAAMWAAVAIWAGVLALVITSQRRTEANARRAASLASRHLDG